MHGVLEYCYIQMGSREYLHGMGFQHGLCSTVAVGCLLCHGSVSVSIYCAPTSSHPHRHRSFSMARWTCHQWLIFEFYISSTLYQVSSLLDASLCQLPWVQPILHLHPLQGPLPAPCPESSFREPRVPISLIRGEKAPSYPDSFRM